MELKLAKPGLFLTITFLVIGFIMFFVAFVVPDWGIRDKPPRRFGIWTACEYDRVLNRNCSAFPGKNLKEEFADDILSFVLTAKVFMFFALISLVIAVACYISSAVKYKDWTIGIGVSFQFFGGMVTMISCILWYSYSFPVNQELGWAFYVAFVAGGLLLINGIVYALLICGGVCYENKTYTETPLPMGFQPHVEYSSKKLSLS